jgi:hypothetical protein
MQTFDDMIEKLLEINKCYEDSKANRKSEDAIDEKEIEKSVHNTRYKRKLNKMGKISKKEK